MRFLGRRALVVLTLWLRAAGGQELEEEDLFLPVERALPEADCVLFADGEPESGTAFSVAIED